MTISKAGGNLLLTDRRSLDRLKSHFIDKVIDPRSEPLRARSPRVGCRGIVVSARKEEKINGTQGKALRGEMF